MKFQKFLEDKVLPVAGSIAQQKHLQAIRSGIVSALPMIMVGSLFLIIWALPFKGWSAKLTQMFGSADVFLAPFRLTMWIMGIYVIIGISHSLAESYEVDATSAGHIALAAYLTSLLGPVMKAGKWTADGRVLKMGGLGATSLFGGIIVSILATEIYRLCVQKNIVFKLPSSVPYSVSKSFAAIIPLLLVVVPTWIIFVILGFDIHSFLKGVLAPMAGFLSGSSFFGMLFIIFITMFLWSLGIHGGSMVGAVVRPFWLQALDQNAKAVTDGIALTKLPNMLPEQFYQWFVWWGGAGATLGLIIAIYLFARKNKELKAVANVSIVPGLFNINEPIIFGLPLIMNPVMSIPFILAPVAMGTVAFIATKVGLVGRMYLVAPWTLPVPIGAFLSSTDWKALVLSLVTLLIAVVIYAPFVKIYDKMLREKANTN